jgi:chitin synthase
MYRLRTADKGKPLIISDDIIRDYSICNVDTLHKKNLLSLGEDRYLTTLMSRYFPNMSYKFVPDAYCQTAAPDEWSVLLSQRRRWINSTIHNLVELMFLPEMCGFCFFSMRFMVFIDLFGTIILPATCVYLGYLIYMIASKTGPFPLISVIMLAVVYGLQALIFILKRQWQHIGWMIIYIIAFPIYFFILPIYSFWNQDNFSWGNTRIVIGESGKKQVVAVDNEAFDPRAIPLQRWDDYATINNLPGRRGGHSEKYGADGGMGMYDENYEMDDMKSVYSSVRQPSVLAGFPARGGAGAYMPPTPGTPGTPFTPGANSMTRTSTFVGTGPYADNNPALAHRQSMMSMGAMDQRRSHTPYADYPANRGSAVNLRGMSGTPPTLGVPGSASNNRLSMASSAMLGGPSPSRLGMHPDLSTGSFNGITAPGGMVDDLAIIDAIQSVLREVDLDTVTKKQVRALVEQRLQTELAGERRTFMDRQIDNELANM